MQLLIWRHHNIDKESGAPVLVSASPYQTSASSDADVHMLFRVNLGSGMDVALGYNVRFIKNHGETGQTSPETRDLSFGGVPGLWVSKCVSWAAVLL